MTERLLPTPPKMMLLFGNSPWLDELAARVRFCAGVSASLTVNATGGRFVRASIVCGGIEEIIGASFVAVTCRTKLLAVYPNPGLSTQTVMLEVPVRSGNGVIVMERLLVVPLNTMALVGTRSGLDEVAPTVRFATGVDASPITKGIVIGVSSSVVRLLKPVRVGTELPDWRIKTVKLWLKLLLGLPLSQTVTVITDEPVPLFAGLRTNEPVAFGLVYVTLLGAGTSEGLLEVTRMTFVWF